MELSGDKTEETTPVIVEAGQRPGTRRRAKMLLADRHPANEAQAELLILEQSLLALARHLGSLIDAPVACGKNGRGKHQKRLR